ncbi:RNA polymerase sigma factor, partial [Chloroflexota bacterium]
MDSKSKLEPSKYDSWSVKKSDDWLVDVLRGENRAEMELALQVLQDRYEGRLRRYVYSKVRGHQWLEADDIVQDAFIAFFWYVQANQIKKSVQALLHRIARNKCADALKKQEREQELENNIPIPDYVDIEVDLEQREIQKFVQQLSFTTPLSGCQRIIILLRKLYEYPPQIVARLMDKSRGTIDTHLSAASKRVEDYLS